MSRTTEIRWHGRGGQGAKTAALLLADVAFKTGKEVQGFPEYGPERMGAPITAYNRISDEKIRTHSNIYEPEYVVVVDETLLESIDVTAGLKEGGCVLVNSNKPAEELRPLMNGYEGDLKVLDARKVSLAALGKYFPNTPLLAGVVKLAGVMDEEVFLREMRESFEHKFARKPEVVEGNMRALEMALKEVH
ncbi:MAG: 2-oxoacid:acceptor oxidoreductase family protein [Clostridiales bacterium]|nr:2-oxoacid:acceptor oxidoreductase family protein [Candidatus Crickella merdequi]